jgi:GNAT superfamily N-acetyltransferase
VKDPGVRIEVIGPEHARLFAEVIRSAFNSKTFTPERWHAMTAGSPYADARCLGAYDDQGNLAAVVTVWSAGPGKPGLIEPMGAHQDHRGRGFGTVITIAAAAALREMGSSSARVCTLSSNVAASPLTRRRGTRRCRRSGTGSGRPSTGRQPISKTPLLCHLRHSSVNIRLEL